jgi:hypothetical protein
MPERVSGGVYNDCELKLRLTLSRDIQLPINKDCICDVRHGGVFQGWWHTTQVDDGQGALK